MAAGFTLYVAFNFRGEVTPSVMAVIISLRFMWWMMILALTRYITLMVTKFLPSSMM